MIDSVDSFIFDGEYALLAEDGENLRTRKTPVAFLASGRFWVNNHAHVFQANKDAVTRYLVYALCGTDLAGYLSGSTQPKLTAKAMNRIKVPCPPTRMQQEIGGLLGALDDKIDVNQRIAAGAERLAVSELAGCAEHCDWVQLGDLAEHLKNTVKPAGIDGLVDHFSLPAFDAGRRPMREAAAAIKSNKLRVPDRAVLLSRLNPRIPRVWYARTTPGVPAVCSTEFLVLQPTGGLSEAELFAACSHPEVLADMARRAGGTSGSHQRVKPADAMAVVVPNPDSERLRSVLTPLIEAAAQARAESEHLAELRDALLPKLLTGELRVGEAEEALEEAAL